MKKKYLFLALILLVSIISISAVSAADDSTRDISVADNNQEIILGGTSLGFYSYPRFSSLTEDISKIRDKVNI